MQSLRDQWYRQRCDRPFALRGYRSEVHRMAKLDLRSWITNPALASRDRPKLCIVAIRTTQLGLAQQEAPDHLTFTETPFVKSCDSNSWWCL